MNNQTEYFTRSHEATDHELATSDVPSLSELLVDNPTLQIFTPSMPGFSALRCIYSLNVTSSPLAIVRPKTSVEITTIVKYTVKNKIPISVRVGGHDMFGRSMPHDTLVIDIRNLNHFTLLLDESAALIGGGIIQSELISKLALTGHTTPFASAPSVGYAGWATLGGYGLLSGAFGLGVDQIIGATLINDTGDIVEANSEMLFALRGGGGSIGIIIAMKIRVYKLPRVLAGLIVFESKNIEERMKAFCTSYRDLQEENLPAPFGAQIAVVNLPGKGRSLISTFMWASVDLDKGYEFLERYKSLGEPVLVAVHEMTPPQWMDMSKDFGTYGVYNGIKSANLSDLSDRYLDIIANHVSRMPVAGATLLFMHQLHGEATKSEPNSCFGSRRPHFVLEILGSSKEEELRDGSLKWATNLHQEIISSKVALKGGYVALLQDHEINGGDCYGENWKKLQDIKRKYDPRNIFRFAVPSGTLMALPT